MKPEQITDGIRRAMSRPFAGSMDRSEPAKPDPALCPPPRRLRLKTPERGVQDEIDLFLRYKEIVFIRPRMDKKTTIKKGWPDFTFALRGRAVAIEVKVPGEKPTPEQERIHAQMRAEPNCWLVYVVYSCAEVKEIVNKETI